MERRARHCVLYSRCKSEASTIVAPLLLLHEDNHATSKSPMASYGTLSQLHAPPARRVIHCRGCSSNVNVELFRWYSCLEPNTQSRSSSPISPSHGQEVEALPSAESPKDWQKGSGCRCVRRRIEGRRPASQRVPGHSSVLPTCQPQRAHADFP